MEKIYYDKIEMYLGKDGVIWAKRKSISKLLSTDVKTLLVHIKRIYRDNKLNSKNTYLKIEEGEFYNQDLIIELGGIINPSSTDMFKSWLKEKPQTQTELSEFDLNMLKALNHKLKP